ncbi:MULTISPECIES: DUF397 domain-containing protein [Streptomyces]|uniref:DUF397 domain-containing protein n=1 Tax=Streptomyces TaxID=1883 RepID=UPI0004CC9AC5|nr:MULTISPECIES: DUF397 domain-containing protein [Streptomyces]KOT65868.1 hypothetical protein ADK43_02335 [Streptomyces rimosus subsp. rimosus]
MTWQKSSYSNEGVNCVNVAAFRDGTLRLRESGAPETVLPVTRDDLAAFLVAIKGHGARPPVRNR